MAWRAAVVLGFASVLWAGAPLRAEENCSIEIEKLEADVEKAKPADARSDEEDLEIELLLAKLVVLCDEFDEWTEGAGAQKDKDEALASLRKITGK